MTFNIDAFTVVIFFCFLLFQIFNFMNTIRNTKFVPETDLDHLLFYPKALNQLM